MDAVELLKKIEDEINNVENIGSEDVIVFFDRTNERAKEILDSYLVDKYQNKNPQDIWRDYCKSKGMVRDPLLICAPRWYMYFAHTIAQILVLMEIEEKKDVEDVGEYFDYTNVHIRSWAYIKNIVFIKNKIEVAKLICSWKNYYENFDPSREESNEKMRELFLTSYIKDDIITFLKESYDPASHGLSVNFVHDKKSNKLNIFKEECSLMGEMDGYYPD